MSKRSFQAISERTSEPSEILQSPTQSACEPHEDDLLMLQSMEQSLVRAQLTESQPLHPAEYDLLRYALRLAALDRFTPAAGKDGATQQVNRLGDVIVDRNLIAPFRESLIHTLSNSFRRGEKYSVRLAAAAALLPQLQVTVHELRTRLLQRHANDLTAAQLDVEIAHKKLVLIAGGGAGAGYVYIGALARLMTAGVAPGYIVGSSIGALLGAFVARYRQPDYRAIHDFSKSLNFADVFGTPRALAKHNLPGLMRLHLRGVAKEFVGASGQPLQLRDLEIPYEAVVAGIRARVHARMPAVSPKPSGEPSRLSGHIAQRAWQLTTLITPNLIDEIVLGRDEETRQFDVLDAIGFSAALPGMLQYDPWHRSERMRGLLAKLCHDRGLTAIADGGVANNVPAKIAWRGVQSGRIGTRNAYYLALDSFGPQTHHKHILMWPVTQAVQLQMPANRPYFDWLLQFKPTLSPANLLPSPADMDQAWAWGWQQMGAVLPMITKAMKPVELNAMPWQQATASVAN